MLSNNYIGYPKREEHSLLSLLKIFLLLWLGGFFVYGISGQVFNSIYFTLIFVLFLFSKNNVFWIAFFWIMILSPWGLFYYRWNNWIISLTPTVGISFTSILPFVLIFKFIILEKRRSIMLRHNRIKLFYKVFSGYIIFLLVWGLIYGYSYTQLTFLLGFLSPFLLFMSLPLLFGPKELIKMNRIIFVFSIFLTLTSIFDLVTRGAFMSLISFGSDRLAGTEVTEGLTRMTGGIYVSLYSVVMGLYYMARRTREFSSKFLWLVVLMSILFIVNSATRGWMISLGFILFVYLLVYVRKTIRYPKVLFSGIAIIVLLYFLLPGAVTKNLDAAFERLATVEAVAEGDMTAGGTAKRWDVRGPMALTRFNESPLFGFGYSKITSDYYDGHVGNHSLLLVGGVIGFAIVYISIFLFVLYLAKLELKGFAPGFFVFAIGLLGIVIIHSTSRNMVSFLMPTDTAFFLGLMFNHINAFFEEHALGLKK